MGRRSLISYVQIADTKPDRIDTKDNTQKKTLVEGLFTIHLSMFLEALSGNPKCGGDSPVKADIKLCLGNNMKHVKWTKQCTEPSLFLLHRRGGLHAESNWVALTPTYCE